MGKEVRFYYEEIFLYFPFGAEMLCCNTLKDTVEKQSLLFGVVAIDFSGGENEVPSEYVQRCNDMTEHFLCILNNLIEEGQKYEIKEI